MVAYSHRALADKSPCLQARGLLFASRYTYQAGLDTIAAACKQHGVVPGMYFIPPDMDPNVFVDKGFKFFTMPWARWALEGIKNGLGGIQRD